LNADPVLLRLIPDAETFGYPEYNYQAYSKNQTDISIQGYFRKKYLMYKTKNQNIDDFLISCKEDIETIEFKK